jgi:hypothetical protein
LLESNEGPWNRADFFTGERGVASVLGEAEAMPPGSLDFLRTFALEMDVALESLERMAIFVLETRPGCFDLVLGAKEMDEAAFFLEGGGANPGAKAADCLDMVEVREMMDDVMGTKGDL